MSNEQRQRIVELVADEGRTHKEVADIYKINKNTVSCIMRTFQKENRIGKCKKGGRKPMFTQAQTRQILDYVEVNNEKRLVDIQAYAVERFQINVSLSTINKILKKNKITMKTLYRIPAARNSPEVLEARAHYARRIIPLARGEVKIMYVDEAGFNLHLRRRRGRNVIGERATVTTPTNRGGNISIGLAISEDSVDHLDVQLTPFNNEKLVTFLTEIFPSIQGRAIIIMDNVPFHHANAVQNCVEAAGHGIIYLPPYSPFLNPIEEAFSKMKLNVRRQSCVDRPALLAAIRAATQTITAADCRQWIYHSRQFLIPSMDRVPITGDLPPGYRGEPEE